jgi:Nucleotidyltransferase of unknown function (DUF6036)
MQRIAPEALDSILSALGDQIRAQGARIEFVVIGGSALSALGLVTRSTRDVDVVALVQDGDLKSAKPFPIPLEQARRRVARDFALEENWLNPGPGDLLEFGLPDGFWDRLTTRQYGDALVVHFASRFDQIHFKLYAMVDQGLGRHEADLRALSPTRDELIQAAKWARTHDPSEGFLMMLEKALHLLGVKDVDLGS